jgi:Na+/proline symporter
LNTLDWLILIGTQLFILIYGIYKTHKQSGIHSYLLSGKEMSWFMVGISIMATQASAITFLSGPGQAFTDGMGFVQFYFGLPLAMIVVSIFAVPLYHKLNVYTAYEYLEKRFDVKTRTLAAILFLSQRGLAAGFTIFAPSLVLSILLNWDIYYTNLIIGGIVVAYTVTGGSKAVNVTQKIQMSIILLGMFLAAYIMVDLLPFEIGTFEALQIAGKAEKLNAIDFTWDWNNKYTFWSGIIGGFFLMLSYFGTDQSQVQRYLGAKSISESRMGLMFNAVLKIPMQFLILLVGVLLYVFYLFYIPPVFFNDVLVNKTIESEYKETWVLNNNQYEFAAQQQRNEVILLNRALKNNENVKEIELRSENLKQSNQKINALRKEAKSIIKLAVPGADVNDNNYIFLSFVKKYLPAGLLGLVISLIFSASMSSTSSELNALASTTLIDIYKRNFRPNLSDQQYLKMSKIFTFAWGIYAIIFAMFANRLGTLIEAVNVLGSLVYGTILGVFLTAFFTKRITGNQVFIAAIIAQAVVLYCFTYTQIPFLWFNAIACSSVLLFSFLLHFIFSQQKAST